MLKRLLAGALAFALLTLPLQAAAQAAADYTDIWYLPAESGWGVNFVQADSVIFATFFIYSQGNVPTWYTAIIYANADASSFTGNLYSTTGTWFGAPWVPSNVVNTQVGTATFTPSSPYQGTLSYSFTSGTPPTVTKIIQRQVLTTIALGGNYLGGQSGAYTGSSCPFSGSYTDTFNLAVAQPGDGTATFTFSYTSGISCTWSGTLVQFGQLYSMPNASYTCTDGTNATASMDQLKATTFGIEAIFSAPSGSQGKSACSEAATFSGNLL